MSCCHLPNGTLLGSYEIKGVLGQGGFGISYWAIDRQLGREIVLKEHYPVGLCKRDIDGAEVIPADSSQENDYNRSLASFCREARIVAALDHPGIVRIHDIFQALGTAYIVMAFAEGCTLDQWLAQHSQDPNQVQKLLFWIYYPICICGKYSTGISNHPISWSRRMVLPFFWILVQLWKDCQRGQ